MSEHQKYFPVLKATENSQAGTKKPKKNMSNLILNKFRLIKLNFTSTSKNLNSIYIKETQSYKV